MSKIGQYVFENEPLDEWQESDNEAACRQMEADGCTKLPDLQPQRMADHINDEPEF